MMKAILCDRCKRMMGKDEPVCKVQFYNRAASEEVGYSYIYDLCKECSDTVKSVVCGEEVPTGLPEEIKEVPEEGIKTS